MKCKHVSSSNTAVLIFHYDVPLHICCYEKLKLLPTRSFPILNRILVFPSENFKEGVRSYHVTEHMQTVFPERGVLKLSVLAHEITLKIVDRSSTSNNF